jgi:hypothetical protein
MDVCITNPWMGCLIQCLGQEEAKRMMSEVHDGLCGAHQSAYRMKWVIRKTGCYWPTMLEDCFEYYKGVKIVKSLAIFIAFQHQL